MTEASQQQPESIVATGSKVWRVLGILLGTATCISLVKNGFAIELYGLPAAIFRQYTWLRDTLFWPVTEVLRYYGLTIPWWLKDAIMAYGLLAAAHSRGINAFTNRTLDYKERIAAMLLWPALAIWTCWGAFSVKGGSYLGRPNPLELRRLGNLILLQLLVVFGSAAAFFL